MPLIVTKFSEARPPELHIDVYFWGLLHQLRLRLLAAATIKDVCAAANPREIKFEGHFGLAFSCVTVFRCIAEALNLLILRASGCTYNEHSEIYDADVCWDYDILFLISMRPYQMPQNIPHTLFMYTGGCTQI